MEEQYEREVIKKIRESNLKWEKAPDKPVYRCETSGFVVYLMPGTESVDLYIKRKTTSEYCKIYRSQYRNPGDWKALLEVKDSVDREIKSAEACLLREFVKDDAEPVVPPKSAVYTEDDLMDNTRTE